LAGTRNDHGLGGDPKLKTVHIRRANAPIQVLAEKDILEGQDVVPGFQFNIADLFSELDLKA
jgi:hypothetical protein